MHCPTGVLVIDLNTFRANRAAVLRDAAAVEELVLRAGGRLLAGESPSGGGFMVCCD